MLLMVDYHAVIFRYFGELNGCRRFATRTVFILVVS